MYRSVYTQVRMHHAKTTQDICRSISYVHIVLLTVMVRLIYITDRDRCNHTTNSVRSHARARARTTQTHAWSHRRREVQYLFQAYNATRSNRSENACKYRASPAAPCGHTLPKCALIVRSEYEIASIAKYHAAVGVLRSNVAVHARAMAARMRAAHALSSRCAFARPSYFGALHGRNWNGRSPSTPHRDGERIPVLLTIAHTSATHVILFFSTHRDTAPRCVSASRYAHARPGIQPGCRSPRVLLLESSPEVPVTSRRTAKLARGCESSRSVLPRAALASWSPRP